MNNVGCVGGGNLSEQLKNVQLIAPAVKSGTITAGPTTGMDRRGYNSAILEINTGAIVANGAMSFTVYDSPDNVTFTAVPSSSKGWGVVAQAASTVSAANTLYTMNLDLRQMQRYVAVGATLDAGTSVLLGVSAALGAADSLPAV